MRPLTRLNGMLVTSGPIGASFSAARKPGAVKRQNSIMHVLSFLDAHSGSIQAITAVVLVIVTIIYTILTRSMAKAARDALRPYVYLDFLFPGGSGARMTVVVGNSGSKAAANVKVTLLKASKDGLRELFQPLPLATGIGHLSPGTRRAYPITVPVSPFILWPTNAPAPVLDFEVSYRDGRHKIKDTQQIDLGGYRSSSPETEDQQERIASELHNISTYMSRLRSAPFSAKACPYCATRIERSATKCPNCLEWLTKKHQSWRSTVLRIRKSHD